MAASEMALGEDHPATHVATQPTAPRIAQLSGEAHGNGEHHGFTPSETVYVEHDYGLDH